MGDVDVFSFGLLDGVDESWPVCMIGEDETSFVAASSAVAAYGHPAGGEGGLRAFEAFHPAGAVAGRGGDDEVSGEFVGFFHFGDGGGGDHFDADVAVDFGEVVDCAVKVDGAVGEFFEFGEDALGFAEGVAEEEGGTVSIGLPPVVDFFGGEFAAVPVIDGEAEGGFGDEAVAFDDFERVAGGVAIAFVVAGDGPDFAFVLYADLGGAEDVSGGVKGDPSVVYFEAIAISYAAEIDVLT